MKKIMTRYPFELYQQMLKSPLWTQRKADVLLRDGYMCFICGNSEDESLEVHHITYLPNKKPWEYLDYYLVTLCRNCHQKEHDLNNINNPIKIHEWICKLLLPNPSSDEFTESYTRSVGFEITSPSLTTVDPLVTYLSHRLKRSGLSEIIDNPEGDTNWIN